MTSGQKKGASLALFCLSFDTNFLKLALPLHWHCRPHHIGIFSVIQVIDSTVKIEWCTGHIFYLPMIIKWYVKMSFFDVLYEVQRYSHNVSTETGVLKRMQYIRSFSAI
jgi:hypothetical protein